ncbi:MAG TPA: putative porin [Gemmatimonadaceae bacterium]|nr:putative porin [Gemmatimonadaceae bacterium]
MSERAPTPADTPAVPDEGTPPPPPPPRRSPGHRGQDVRDTVAELAARAHEISLEAGSKMSSALKDVINAAAGITTFAVESARDLVQYMVRRGQMTQDEADKLIREAEAASAKRAKPAARPEADHKHAAPAAKRPSAKAAAPKPAPAARKPAAKKPAAKKASPKKK